MFYDKINFLAENKKRDDKITKLTLIGIGNKIWYAA